MSALGHKRTCRHLLDHLSSLGDAQHAVIESFADVAREVSMKSTATHRRRCSLAVVLALVLSNPAFAQICKPVSQRTGELGCWIVAHESMGQLTQPQVFWHLDVYPTRASAEAAK